MDKIVKLNRLSKTRSRPVGTKTFQRPPREAAEDAVRTLIRWSGDDPDREGLIGTPARVVRAYEDWFAGYFEDPREYLKRTFEEVGGYDEIVLLRDIPFESHCEHHMAPIIGRVHIRSHRKELGVTNANLPNASLVHDWCSIGARSCRTWTDAR